MNTDEIPKSIYSKRFDIDTEKSEMLEYLEKYGYVVVKEVANKDERITGISLMWDFLENYSEAGSSANRNDSSTWDFDNDWLPSSTNGILNGIGFGQSKFLWHTRLLKKVKASFEAIWNTSHLITSFDGGNIFRPWRNKKEWKTRGNWWHTDQNGFFDNNRGRICVQGVLSYLDANESTGGLCVIVGSHKQHTEICCRNPLAYMEGDFLKISKEDPIMSIEYEKRLVCCKAGDLILWDSRTIHCNTPGIENDISELNNTNGQDKEVNNNEIDHEQLIRICAYVCMSPLSFANPTILNLRRQAFIYNISSSHWPYKNISSHKASSYYLPNNTLTIGKDTFSAPTGALTLEQRLLIELKLWIQH